VPPVSASVAVRTAGVGNVTVNGPVPDVVMPEMPVTPEIPLSADVIAAAAALCAIGAVGTPFTSSVKLPPVGAPSTSTVSGRTYEQVAAIDQALYTKEVLTAGGRYYGDTYTNPTTIP
jgi:hypothetical protein